MSGRTPGWTMPMTDKALAFLPRPSTGPMRLEIRPMSWSARRYAAGTFYTNSHAVSAPGQQLQI
jgi:hypothetical protein